MKAARSPRLQNQAVDAASETAAARPAATPPVWRQDDGAPVSCLEKIKVLNENYAELRQMTQDAFEDALLIGCSEAQVRQALHGLIDAMVNPYPGKAADSGTPPARKP